MSDRRENLIEVKRYAIIVNVPLERPIPLNFEQSMEGLKKFSIWRREATCFTEKEKKQNGKKAGNDFSLFKIIIKVG